ncbi:unnamed protein product [Calypogeia fissa]
MGRRTKRTNAKEGSAQTVKSATYVVAIDFGTTFSGAAFAKLTDVQSKGRNGDDGIQLHDNWPGQAEAGAKVYSKTQTSVWYMPGSIPGAFDLKGWGWSGYLAYMESAQNAGMIMNEIRQPVHYSDCRFSSRVSERCTEKVPQNCGYFVKNFKLGLAGVHQNLPQGLKIERVISDYLREL